MNIEKKIQDLKLTNLLRSSTSIKSIKDDFGYAIYACLIILPFIGAIGGFIGDMAVVKSIIHNATQKDLLAYTSALIIALSIQAVLFKTPTAIGKNFRFVFSTINKKENRSKWSKRHTKSLFFSLFFSLLVGLTLKGSLSLNNQSDSIVDSFVLQIIAEDTISEITSKEGGAVILSSKLSTDEAALKNRDRQLEKINSEIMSLVNSNSKARYYFEEKEKAEKNNKMQFAAKMEDMMFKQLDKNEYSKLKRRKQAIEDNYNSIINMSTSIASVQSQELIGSQQTKFELRKKAQKNLKSFLLNFLRYANWYVVIAAFALGFMAKDFRENEDNEIDLTTLDSHLSGKK